MKHVWLNLVTAAIVAVAAIPVTSGTLATEDGARLQASATENIKEEIMFGADCFVGEQANAFAERKNGDYLKISPDAGRDYLYHNGQAVAGESYVFSGTISMSHCAEDAVAEIVLKAKNGFARFFLRFNNQSNYSLISHLSTVGEERVQMLAERDSGRMNFLLMWHDGNAYLYIDNTFIKKVETPFESVHLGFGGEGSRLSIERISVAENDRLIEKLLNDLAKPFGRHVTGDADFYEAVFLKTGDNEYEKRTYHYLQAYYYIDGRPASGDYYWVAGTIQMKNAEPNGQVALMITRDEGNKVRFVLERERDFERYHMFTDVCVGGAFTGYRGLGVVTDTIYFKVEYDHGVSRLYLNGLLYATIERDEGVAHFGIGGDNCQFAVRDLRGGFEREET